MSNETCKVKKNNADFFVSATEKTIKLKTGTSISWTNGYMNQGLIVVKTKVGKKWIQGEQFLAVVRDCGGKTCLEFPIGNVIFETAGWISYPRFSPDGKKSLLSNIR